MKKTVIAASMALAFGAMGSANAAFTSMADGNYTLTIDSGCFAFDNCQVSGNGTLTDNTTANQADASAFGSPAGSGIVGDGFMGVISFTLTGGNISVTSYSQDSYLGTAGGTFYIRASDMSTMGGSIDGSGNMSFDPTGRTGLAANYAGTLGEQPWAYQSFTTGTSTNAAQGFTPPFSMTGSALQDAGAGVWTGTLVAAGNVGPEWGGFNTQQYSELFNVTITAETSAVPVPAAVWLFGSGLMGLVGIARRKKA